MENYNYNEDLAKLRARKKLKKLKGFYINLICYCIFIPFIIYINLRYSPEYHWFWYSIGGWGISILFNAWSVFGPELFLGSDWEDRKIKELMDKDKTTTNN
jgi:2TM domain